MILQTAFGAGTLGAGKKDTLDNESRLPLEDSRSRICIFIFTLTPPFAEVNLKAVEGVGHYEPLRHYAEVHLLLEPGVEPSIYL